MNKSEYETSQLDIERIQATEKGKQAVKDFVDALNRRLKIDRKYDSDFRNDSFNMDNKYALCAWYFFKWLVEIKEFDLLNTPIFNVPILTIWQRWDGKIMYTHNIVESGTVNAQFKAYCRFRRMIIFMLRKMKKMQKGKTRTMNIRPFKVLYDILTLKLAQLNKRIELADKYFNWLQDYTKRMDRWLAKQERKE